VDPFAALGATYAESPAALGQACEIVGLIAQAPLISVAQNFNGFDQRRPASRRFELECIEEGRAEPAQRALRFRYAPPVASHGAGANLALTINTDHS